MDENATTPSAPPGKEPEKYIRTFTSDRDTLEKGGVPNLAPLAEESHAAPLERLVAPSPIGAAPLPPPPVQIPQPVPVRMSPSPLATDLKTYAGDFRERMKDTRASTMTVLAAEQDSAPQAAQASQAVPESSSRNGLFYSIAGVILLIVGVVGAYIAYTHYLASSTPVVPVSNVSAPIFVDESEQLSGTSQVLLEAIKQSVARPLAPGAIRLLYIASTTTKSVFSTLPLSVPDMLLRNINADSSMAGIIHAGNNQSPFFILSVSSYSNTFAAMLSWETAMPRALGALFSAYPSPIAASTTTATTTQPISTTTPLVGAQKLSFHDEVVSNHDVRVYRDDMGRSIILYGYWNQTTLIIARDPVAFTGILERLATSRAQ